MKRALICHEIKNDVIYRIRKLNVVKVKIVHVNSVVDDYNEDLERRWQGRLE